MTYLCVFINQAEADCKGKGLVHTSSFVSQSWMPVLSLTDFRSLAQ